MLNYLSKFVLQMLPTISATVIGAYIVATWIDPKTPPPAAKIAAQSPAQNRDQKPAETATAAQPTQEAAAEVIEAKPAEAAKPVKGASAPEKVRVISLSKPAEATPSTAMASTASVPQTEAAAIVDERKDANKDANELARAAIMRLRGSETPRVADEPVKPTASVVRTQQARVQPEAVPQPVATVAPPLPPAVSITAPRIVPGESVDQAAAGYPRMTPPAEIPVARNPLNLQASARIGENQSIADDFLSATKSFFRAITP